MLLIKNAKIINADKITKQIKDILIEKDKIVKIDSSIDFDNKNIKIIDAEGKYVLPGLIDMHVHLREPGEEHKETIETGMKAAARGGFTTILCMPNTNPTLDNANVISSVLKEAARVGTINVLPVGAITKARKGKELSDMLELKEAGCIAISDDGTGLMNAQIMRLALEYANMAGLLIMQHCQDSQLSRLSVMNEGKISTLLGLKGDPGMSETVMVSRDIELANYLNVPVYFQHVSLKRSVELIKFAKQKGIKVFAEVTPHHLSLTEEDLISFDTKYKVNPPLRTKEDVKALRKAIINGDIDCIATDHAPHSIEDKEKDFNQAAFGMIGLETALGIIVKELVSQQGFDWTSLVSRMSAKPAEILGMDNKGKIKEGCDADLIIVDVEKKWIVDEKDFESKSKNSPFIGKELQGKVLKTVCGGKVVY